MNVNNQATLNSNLSLLNFCVHALRFKLWRQMRYISLPGFVRKSFCRPLPREVSLSWLPCSAAEWVSSDGRGAGWWGGYVNEMLSDPATITNHQSDLISLLAEWVGGLVAALVSASSTRSTTQTPGIHLRSTKTTTVVGRGWCLCPDWIWRTCKSSSKLQLRAWDQSLHVHKHKLTYSMHKLHSQRKLPYLLNSYNSTVCTGWRLFEG